MGLPKLGHLQAHNILSFSLCFVKVLWPWRWPTFIYILPTLSLVLAQFNGEAIPPIPWHSHVLMMWHRPWLCWLLPCDDWIYDHKILTVYMDEWPWTLSSSQLLVWFCAVTNVTVGFIYSSFGYCIYFVPYFDLSCNSVTEHRTMNF